MNRHLIYLICFVAVSCSTSVDLEDNFRLDVSASVVDEQGRPLTSANSFTVGDKFEDPLSSFLNQDYLGEGSADSAGYISYTSLVQDDGTTYCYVSAGSDRVVYETVLKAGNPEISDGILTLGEITLKQVATVLILFEDDSGLSRGLSYEINYESRACGRIFSDDSGEFTTPCYGRRNRTNQFFLAQSGTRIEIPTTLGSYIEIRYTPENGQTITETFEVTERSQGYEVRY